MAEFPAGKCREWPPGWPASAEAVGGKRPAPIAELAAKPDARGCFPCNPACRPACDAPAPGNRANRRDQACLDARPDSVSRPARCPGTNHFRCRTFLWPRTHLPAAFYRQSTPKTSEAGWQTRYNRTLKLAIIGYGNVGRALARLLRAKRSSSVSAKRETIGLALITRVVR